MRKSPRQRRLEADFRAVCRLREESSIFDFEAGGNPPQAYRFLFRGCGVYRAPDHLIRTIYEHTVIVELGAAYPRMIPNIAWQTPIFHPNISSGGVVCLGGYGTNWVPSLSLDEMCVMLWDMIRYANFDPESPYNRDAAYWAKVQTDLPLPLDGRPLRDRVSVRDATAAHGAPTTGHPPVISWVDASPVEIIDAEVVVANSVVDRHTPDDSSSRSSADDSSTTADGHSRNRSEILFID